MWGMKPALVASLYMCFCEYAQDYPCLAHLRLKASECHDELSSFLLLGGEAWNEVFTRDQRRVDDALKKRAKKAERATEARKRGNEKEAQEAEAEESGVEEIFESFKRWVKKPDR